MKKIDVPFLKKYRFYLISALTMVVWLTFFDRSNLLKQFDMALELRQMQKQKEFFEKELADVKKEEAEVLGSMASLEKYGREKYLMKKEGETVFVLVDENEQILKEGK
ncbi:MAG: septum formation initiator family protein [Spirosomataceae bacterium]|jgi:cell division protein FtsB